MFETHHGWVAHEDNIKEFIKILRNEFPKEIGFQNSGWHQAFDILLRKLAGEKLR